MEAASILWRDFTRTVFKHVAPQNDAKWLFVFFATERMMVDHELKYNVVYFELLEKYGTRGEYWNIPTP